MINEPVFAFIGSARPAAQRRVGNPAPPLPDTLEAEARAPLAAQGKEAS